MDIFDTIELPEEERRKDIFDTIDPPEKEPVPETEYHVKGASMSALLGAGRAAGGSLPTAGGILEEIASPAAIAWNIANKLVGKEGLEYQSAVGNIGEKNKAVFDAIMEQDPDVQDLRRSQAKGTESIFTEALGSTGETAAGLATSLIPVIGPAMATGMFLDLNSEEIYEQAIEKGASENRARVASIVGGGINTLGDMTGIKWLQKSFGPAKELSKFLFNLGGTAAVEGTTEGFQEAVGIIAAEWAAKPGDETQKQFISRMVEMLPEIGKRSVHAAKIGALIGGGMSTAGGAASLAFPAEEVPAPPSKGKKKDIFDGLQYSAEEIAEFIETPAEKPKPAQDEAQIKQVPKVEPKAVPSEVPKKGKPVGPLPTEIKPVEVSDPALEFLLKPKSENPLIGVEKGKFNKDGISALKQKSEQGESVRYVYSENGKIVSSMQVMITPKGKATATNAFTDPSFRRKGLSLKLIEKAQKDIPEIILSEEQSAAMKGVLKKIKKEPPTPTKAEKPKVAPVEKREVVKIAIAEDMRRGLQTELGSVKVGEPGGRIKVGEGPEAEIKGYSSTYPPWMTNKGWNKKEVVTALEKAVGDKPLGVRQAAIVDAAIADVEYQKSYIEVQNDPDIKESEIREIQESTFKEVKGEHAEETREVDSFNWKTGEFEKPAEKPKVSPVKEIKPIYKDIGMGQKVINVEATEKSLPQVKPGHVRLYRAERPDGVKYEEIFDTSKDEVVKEKEGQYYTPDLKFADYFRGTYGKDSKIKYVDVPENIAKAGKINETEYIIKTPSKIISTLKDETGTSNVINDLAFHGAILIRQGHTDFKSFHAQMKKTFAEVWDKIKDEIRKIYRMAQRLAKEERGSVEIRKGKAAKKAGPAKVIKETFVSSEKDPFGKRVAKAYKDIRDPVKRKHMLDNLVQKVLDSRHSLLVYGETIPGMKRAYSFYAAQRGLPGIFETMLTHGKLIMTKEGVGTIETRKQGFKKFVSSMGKEADNFFHWMMAMRSRELMLNGKKNFISKETREKLFEATRPYTDKQFQKWAKEMRDWNDSVLDFAEAAGIINPQSRKSWEQNYYLPVHRIFENEQEKHRFLTRPDMLDAGIRQLIGGGQKIGDPLEAIMKNWIHLIDTSLKHMSVKQAAQSLQKAGSKEFRPLPASRIAIKVDSDTGQAVYLYKQKPTFVEKQMVDPGGLKDNALMYLEKGRPRYFAVEDPMLFSAMSNMKVNQFNNLLFRMARTAKNWLTYGATFGPGFRIANMFRDTIHTSLVEKSFMPALDTAIGLVKVLARNKEFVELMASGYGFGTHMKTGDVAELAKFVKKTTGIKKKGAAAKVVLPAKFLLDMWDILGQASEQAARTQLYSKLRKQGMSRAEAGFRAKDLLDFSRTGEASLVQMMIQTIPFLNARMQGLAKIGKTAINKETRGNMLLRSGILMGMSMALWWWNKDKDEYKALNDYEKWTYYHFFIGDMVVRLPMPFELGALFSAWPEAVANTFYGNEKSKHIMDTIGHTLFDTFALGHPQLYKPIYEQLKNEIGYTGAPIVPMSLQGVAPGEQAKPWTSKTLKVLGKKLGVSPLRAEHLLRGYFSVFGQFLLGGMDVLVDAAFDFPEDPTARLADQPFIGRFLRSTSAPTSTKYGSWFYDAMRELDELVRTKNLYERQGRIEEMREMERKEARKLRLKPKFNRLKRDAAELNGQMRKVMASKMSGTEKRKRINELIKKRNAKFKLMHDEAGKIL